MISRIPGLLVALAAAGCATTPAPVPPQAPGTLTLHADAGFWAQKDEIGPQVSADIGFEKPGCCGAALYLGMASDVPEVDRQSAEGEVPNGSILEGGLEVGVVLLEAQGLRLRARVGKAGTTPKAPLGGRSGLATSAAVLYRLADLGVPAVNVGIPAVNASSPSLDLFVGGAHWTLGSQSSPAGSHLDDRMHTSVIVGLRVGAAHGVDFD